MPESTFSEEILWRQFISGNSFAFEKLVDSTYRLLFQYGGKFCRDQDLVKDCIQDVFLALWESRLSLNSSIPPRPYLLASLRRRINRKVQSDRLELNSIDENFFCTEFTIEEDLIEMEESREMSSKLSYLFNHLPPRQKEIIYLKFYQNLTREEIAEVMQISPQSVSNLFQKSLYWLRNNWASPTLLSLVGLFNYFKIFLSK